ncbi:MAG: hypothetical protein ACJAX5_003050 [Patiriisocius sp.]|jgi:hypothetical protein
MKPNSIIIVFIGLALALGLGAWRKFAPVQTTVVVPD